MKCLPSLAAFSLLSVLPLLGEEETVKIFESSRPVGAEERHTLQLSGPLVNFDVNYATLDGSGEGVGDPYTAAVHVNEIPAAPALSFNVTAPGFTLARQPFTVDLVQNAPGRKGARVSWNLAGGNVVLTLIVNENDPVLYGRLCVERAEAFRILLLLAPGGYAATNDERDRWFFAGNDDRQHATDALPVESNWLLLYDKRLDPEQSRGKGAAGLLWSGLPDSTVTFQCGAYVSSLVVNVPSGDEIREFDFILWPFEGVPNESAKEEIKQGAAARLEKLAKEKDAIFREAK